MRGQGHNPDGKNKTVAHLRWWWYVSFVRSCFRPLARVVVCLVVRSLVRSFVRSFVRGCVC